MEADVRVREDGGTVLPRVCRMYERKVEIEGNLYHTEGGEVSRIPPKGDVTTL